MRLFIIFILFLTLLDANSQSLEKLFEDSEKTSVDKKSKFKSIFIYKFCELTEWPKDVLTDTFHIGVIANKSQALSLHQVSRSKTIAGKPVRVHFFERDDDVTKAHMLYSDYQDGVEAKDLFKAIGDRPILLVSEGYDFNQTMINFIVSDNQIKYQLNRNRLEQQGLKISEALAKLAVKTNAKDWKTEVERLRENLKIEKEKSANLSTENIKLNTQVEELEFTVLDLEYSIDQLNEEIEVSKAELKTIFDRIGVQKDVYLKLVAQLDDKEKSLADNQALLIEKNHELETKQLELETNENRLKLQRDELEATATAMMDVENKMSNALRLLDNQKLVSYAISGIALLILILGIIAFNNYRKQRKQATIIAAQRDEVESQRDEIHEQHEQLEEKSKEITDSIVYAKRIQQAILPPARLVSQYLENSFILYKPKDIVAGDFYWMEPVGDSVIFAAADCTGHGVPGAMVSVVCSNALNRAVREFGLTEPAKILDKTLELVIERFDKSEEDVKDGMDIALCALNTKTNELQYAGANNPLWIISTNAEMKSSPASTQLSTGLERDAPTERGVFLHEIKATKQPIGKYSEPKPYENHSISLQAGDSVYVFTDGFPDQFGGDRGKKLKTRAFKELLLSIQDKSMSDQHKMIDDYFENWRGSNEQIDDVCVIGVRI